MYIYIYIYSNDARKTPKRRYVLLDNASVVLYILRLLMYSFMKGSIIVLYILRFLSSSFPIQSEWNEFDIF